MSRQRLGDQGGDLELDALPHWRDVVTSPSARHQPSGSVLDRLHATHQIVGESTVRRVARVQSTSNKRLEGRLRCILRLATDDWSQLSQVEEAALTDSNHVGTQQQTTVDDYAQVTCCSLDSDSPRQDWYTVPGSIGRGGG